MDTLPTPLSRVELYLAVAAGMTGVTMPEKPLSRLEQFLAVIAGDTSVELPTPHSLTEIWLAYVAGITPDPLPEVIGAHYCDNQKVDTRYFAVAAGMPGAVVPAKPQNRKEQYWAQIAIIKPIHSVLKYATGTNIVLTDVVSGIEELQYVYGNTTQTTLSGKNLIDYLSPTYISDSGATAVINANSVTIEKTLDGQYRFAILRLTSEQTNNILGKTLTLSYNKSASKSSVKYGIRLFWMAGNSVVAGDLIAGTLDTTTGKQVDTFTLPSTPPDNTKPLVALLFYPDNTNSDVADSSVMTVSDLQLEFGSTATPYEKFCGGIPSPNPDYPQNVNVVTGSQNVWVHGKNLIDPSSFVEGRVDSGNIGYASNTTSLSYTATSVTFTTNKSYRGVVSGLIKVKPNTRYTLTFNGTVDRYIDAYDSNNTWITRISLLTDPTPANTAYLRVSFQLPSVGTVTVSDIQLEEGNSASSFEPYQSNNYTVDLTSKNLLPFTNQDFTLKGITYKAIDGSLYLDGTSQGETPSNSAEFKTNFTFTLEAGTYTLSLPEDTTPSYIRKVSDGSQIAVVNGGTAKTATFTLAEDTECYLGFYVYNRIWSDKKALLQLEKSSSATSYQSCFDYELCKIGTYQDYIYKSGDDWYVKKAIGKQTYTGAESENWISATYGVNSYYIALTNRMAPDSSTPNLNYSNLFRGVPFSERVTAGDNIIYLSGEGLYVRNTSFASLSDFKTALGTTNLISYYVLATPTDTKITDATLISQLEAINDAILPKPNATIEISATSTNLPAPIKISYYGEEE